MIVPADQHPPMRGTPNWPTKPNTKLRMVSTIHTGCKEKEALLISVDGIPYCTPQYSQCEGACPLSGRKFDDLF